MFPPNDYFLATSVVAAPRFSMASPEAIVKPLQDYLESTGTLSIHLDIRACNDGLDHLIALLTSRAEGDGIFRYR